MSPVAVARSPPSSPLLRAAQQTAALHDLPIHFIPPTQSLTDLLHRALAATPPPPSHYIADLSAVARQLALFRTHLPAVTPFYAVKCRPDPPLLSFLAHLGTSFDCASHQELQLVSDVFAAPDLRNRSLAHHVIFANAVKIPRDLTYAAQLGVSLMTFDNHDELVKIKRLHPNAKLLLRVAVDDSTSVCPLSSKFGIILEELPQILQTIKSLDLNLVGVAFHAGSGSTSLAPYEQGIDLAAQIFRDVQAAGLPPLSILDIGGGFPGHDDESPVSFVQIAATIRRHLQKLPSDVRVIAEPGRLFVASAFTLATRVVLERSDVHKRTYHLAEGVFTSFKDARILNIDFPPKVLSLKDDIMYDDVQDTDLRGPSRTSVDVIARNVRLPSLSVGDWLYFENMGAYTATLASRNAGIPASTSYYLRVSQED